MCTVTVHRDGAALSVTMNRDEARTRGPELAPQRFQRADGPDWIAPLDSDSGGTWMGVNEAGMVACLLNRYQNYDVAQLPDNPKSRGEIVPELLRHESVEVAAAWMKTKAFQPQFYPPFTILLVDLNGGVCIDWRGQGEMLCSPLDASWHMLSSSFFDPDTVLPWRRAAFDAWREAGAPHTHGIPTFHVFQPEGKAENAPLMARDISCTRSITQAQVGGADGPISMRHGAVVDSRVAWDLFEVCHDFDSTIPESSERRER